MSFVTTQPDVLSGAASSLSGIGDAMVARNAAAAAPEVKNFLRLAFVKSAGFFDAWFLFESMGFSSSSVSLAPSECFEGTCF